MISYVVAMDENHLIGSKNKLPWHLPADLKYFKKVTMNKPIVMGRKTYESIGKPLPGRENIVLTRDRNYKAEGCTVIYSVEDIIKRDNEEICVIGGAEVFRLFMPYVNRMYITKIHETFEGDTYFPDFNEKEWKIVSKTPGQVDEKNKYPHDFIVYDKKMS
ncbi:dihydrofolate reductase [Fictibacillus sp. Mic-4]|uniref:dihydrofolate reductase n=1 Tax=Fictibacillus TaxID=1329200 RepID=UPI0003FB9BCA|nr:dihydrofolate reductase [Fictibacillus gelatini]